MTDVGLLACSIDRALRTLVGGDQGEEIADRRTVKPVPSRLKPTAAKVGDIVLPPGKASRIAIGVQTLRKPCWPIPDSTISCSPATVILPTMPAHRRLRAVWRSSALGPIPAQAAWSALSTGGRARQALQLLLRGRRMPVAEDAGVAALPRPPGLCRGNRGADRDFAARRNELTDGAALGGRQR